LVVAGALMSPSWAVADIGVGVKVGTLGAGVELTKDFSSRFNGRVGFNTLKLDRSGTEDDINYDINLELSSVTLLLDWHPFNGGFRVTGGAAVNNNELALVGKSNTSYTIGDNTYTPAEVGTLTGDVTFDNLTPYLGIGWGNAVGEDDKITFALDIGVLFQGSTEAKLSADGSLASDPTFQADLAKEEQNLNQSLDDFELYPVISAGIAYHF
jgi:hypothetical protein